MPQPDTALVASIVVRTYNEERHLGNLFDALEAQDLQGFETIVVDSGSQDRSREIGAARATRLIRISPGDFTFGYSLNTGIGAARAQTVAIVSAHAIPSTSAWLRRLVEHFEDPETAMVYGRQVAGATTKFSERSDFIRTFGSIPRRLTAPDFFANNANSAIRRSLWLEHPFDEALTGLEDIEWAKHWMQRGMAVVYEPAAAVAHLHDETWPQVRHRYQREVQAATRVGILSPADAPRLLLREATLLAQDAAAALLLGTPAIVAEVVRFRYEKLRGTMRGLHKGSGSAVTAEDRRLLFESDYDAVVVQGPGRSALQRVAIPVLKPGEVLLRVAYEGVCATDLEIAAGTLGYYRSGLATYPITPGHELSATVAAIGARVTNWTEGDRVVVECIQGCGVCGNCRNENFIGCEVRREVGVVGLDGGYAEYMVTPERFLHRVPDTLSLRQAALCEPLAVVLKALRRLERVIGVGDPAPRCLVIGAGTIGHLAARVLANRGIPVTVYDRDASRLALFQSERIETTSDMSALSSAPVVVEATGDAEILHHALELTPAGATLLLLGLPYARKDFSFETLVGFDKTVVGSVGSEARDFEEALAILPQLDTSVLTARSVALSDFSTAWDLVRNRKYLKVMLEVDEGAPAPVLGGS